MNTCPGQQFDPHINHKLDLPLYIIHLSLYTIEVMIQRQSSSSHIHKLERENKLLNHQLKHKDGLIQIKDKKIEELEKIIFQHQTEGKDREQGHVQGCCLPFGRVESVSRVGCTLRDREEMDVGLQLAVEKEQQLSKLRLQLQEKEQLIAKLYSQAFILHKKMLTQDDAMNHMEEQIKQLSLNNQSKGKVSPCKQQHALETLPKDSEEGVGQSSIILQNIIIQNQKSKKESLGYQQAKMANQLAMEAMTQESDIMKKTINNYDWKLFCLETQLQLANKDRTRIKEDSQAKDRQIGQFQVQVQELNNKLITLQEQLHILCEENNFFQMQISQKQIRIQELLVQIQGLKDNQENQQLKELTYSNKEKDDELKEMTKFLKEKISQNHSLKVKCTQLQSSHEQVLRKKQKVQFQNYYLQERFAQHEQDLQKQAQQIETAEKEIAELKNFSNIHLIRGQELQKQTQIMQGIIYEQQQKLSEFNDQKNYLQKKLQETAFQLNALDAKSKSFADSYEKETNHLNMLILTKDKQIQKIVRKMEKQELSLKSKEKTIQILKSELKTTTTDLKETRFINQKYQQELQEMQGVIEVNEEKLKILKRETVGNIESEVNYELQLQNAQKSILSLELENRNLQARHNSREEVITKLKKQMNDLRSLTHSKLDEITSYISDTNFEVEETTTFQILVDDESFQVPLSAIQRQRSEFKKKLSDYCEQFQAICSNSTE